MITAAQTVEVRFKGTRKGYYLWNSPQDPLRITDGVIVEADRGHDFGRVSAIGEAAAKKCGSACGGCAVGREEPAEPLRTVVRRATQEDIRSANDVRKSEEDVRRKVMERVRHHELLMKVSDTEWQWDRARLTIYFTAEKRVDFRTLVRDLATLFRTRIELRQIGVRDEAARLTGVGRCGREYCCSTWLKELSPVNLGLAKDQHLSLNPSQISGGCGRLLCCLKYEHEFYVASRKRFPKEGKALRTAAGIEKVVAVDIFRERVYLRGEGQPSRIISLVQLREELESAELAGPPITAARPAARPSSPAPRVDPAGASGPRSTPAASAAPPSSRSPDASAAPAAPLPADAAADPAGPDPAAPDGPREERRTGNRRRRRRRGRRRGSGEQPGPGGE
ncbi:MAG TPA: regulatory iron-sulfur-containing complex subunit RicT [Gemmatimonadales bacterium]